jgi:hypothetical protein
MPRVVSKGGSYTCLHCGRSSVGTTSGEGTPDKLHSTTWGIILWRQAYSHQYTTVPWAQSDWLTKALRYSGSRRRVATLYFRQVFGWPWMRTVTFYPRIGFFL